LRLVACSSRTRIVASELGDGLIRSMRGAMKLMVHFPEG